MTIIPNDRTNLPGNNTEFLNVYVTLFVNYVRKHNLPVFDTEEIIFNTGKDTRRAYCTDLTTKGNCTAVEEKMKKYLETGKYYNKRDDDHLTRYTNCCYLQNYRDFYVLVDGKLYFFDF